MFKKGHPRYGGRKKGSQTLLDKCKEMNVDVFEEALRLAINDPDFDNKFNKLAALMPYLYAKPKDEFDISKLTPEQIREYLLEIVNDGQDRSA